MLSHPNLVRVEFEPEVDNLSIDVSLWEKKRQVLIDHLVFEILRKQSLYRTQKL